MGSHKAGGQQNYLAKVESAIDIGIYCDITPTEFKYPDGHKLFTARCKICGREVLKQLSDLKRHNRVCAHGNQKTNIKDKRIRKIFFGMKSRCCNPVDEDYGIYGGKGVSICDEWFHNPALFELWSLKNGYEGSLSIDRINSDGDYCPENCRWITLEENAKYKSTTRLLEIDGETHTGRDWALKLNLGVGRINKYLNKYPEEVVKDFIGYCIDNGLPSRANRQSYIDAYLAGKQQRPS